jgi:hypothetical protein
VSWLGLKAQLLADTLRGIAVRLLGDKEHYLELFGPNVDGSRVGDGGPDARDPVRVAGVVDVVGHSWEPFCALQAGAASGTSAGWSGATTR